MLEEAGVSILQFQYHECDCIKYILEQSNFGDTDIIHIL